MKAKKVFMIIVQTIVFAAIGFVIGLFITKLLGNDSQAASQPQEKTDKLRLVIALVVLFVSYILTIIIHESGHLVMGLLTGYKFVSFRIGSLTLVRQNEKFVLRKYSVAGTGGQCLMTRDIPQKDEEIPYFWYNLGGGLFNLLTAAICFPILISVSNQYVKILLMIPMLLSAFLGLVNLVPLKFIGISNDGANILELHRSPNVRRQIVNLLIINARQCEGETLDEMPDTLFDIGEAAGGIYAANLTLITALRYIERKDYATAKKLLSTILADKKNLEVLRNEAGCEQLFCDIMTGEPAQIIDESYEDLKKYIELTIKTSMSRRRLMFAYYYIYKRDKAKADKEYDLAVKLSKNLAILGEAKSEMSLIEYVKEKSLI